MFKWWKERAIRKAYWDKPIETPRFRIIFKTPYYYLEVFRPDDRRWHHISLSRDKEMLRPQVDDFKQRELEAPEYID